MHTPMHVCRCETLIEGNPALYKSYLSILHAQLKLVPDDFFATELSKENFLVSSLSAMFQVNVDCLSVYAQVFERVTYKVLVYANTIVAVKAKSDTYID